MDYGKLLKELLQILHYIQLYAAMNLAMNLWKCHIISSYKFIKVQRVSFSALLSSNNPISNQNKLIQTPTI